MRRTDRITAATLAERLQTGEASYTLDVRTDAEWQQGRIEGSVNIPVTHLEQRLGEVPKDRRIVVHCASGYRSSIAASLLEKHGFTQVTDLVGGYAAWEKATGGGKAAAC